VRDFLEQFRSSPPAIAPAPPTVRAVTGWLTRHPDSLTEDEQPQLKAILEGCPQLGAAAGHIRSFGEMLTQLTATTCRRGSAPSAPTICRVCARLLPGWRPTLLL
jgi:hypothetical protein